MLDNSPLRELLTAAVPFDRLPQLLASHELQALAITASSYSSGEHVTFYEAASAIEPWTRSQRLAVPARLQAEHLLAEPMSDGRMFYRRRERNLVFPRTQELHFSRLQQWGINAN